LVAVQVLSHGIKSKQQLPSGLRAVSKHQVQMYNGNAELCRQANGQSNRACVLVQVCILQLTMYFYQPHSIMRATGGGRHMLGRWSMRHSQALTWLQAHTSHRLVYVGA
jgi:hypothetical protein